MNQLGDTQRLILNVITENDGIQTGAIAKQVGRDNRSVNRHMHELLDQGLVVKTGQGRSVSYTVAPGNKIKQPVDIEEYFKVHYLDRKVNEQFNFDVFDYLQGNIFNSSELDYLNKLQKRFTENISRYDSQTLINKEYERIMIEFSWKSSSIEGNTYSLLNTEALLKENVADPTKTDEETQMILNHKDAFNESIQNRERFQTLQLMDLEYIHSILTKHIGIKKNIRKHGVGITGTKYRPLDNEYQIVEVLRKTIDLVNNKESLFEKAFIVLIMLSYIQAFEDGNKRVARTVSNAVLLSHGSIPLSYRAVQVVEYKKASVLFYEIQNISYFKEIFIEQFRDAVENYFV